MATYSTLQTATKELCGLPSSNTSYDTKIKRWLNDGQADFSNETNWKYLETRGSCASSTFQFKYTLADNVDVIKSVIWEHDHYLQPVNHDTWVRLNLSDQTGTPRNYIILGGSLCLWPKPDHAASEGVLNGAMSATGTDSIILTSSSNFEEKGRVLVGTEKIEYANNDTPSLEICIRGTELTTPATHAVGAIVYQQNIEYDYFKTLPDMSADGDVSGIPARYHRALPFYATAMFFYSTEDINNGDKFMNQYIVVREQAKKDLSEKQAQSWSSSLDDDQYEMSFKEIDNTFPQNSSLQ